MKIAFSFEKKILNGHKAIIGILTILVHDVKELSINISAAALALCIGSRGRRDISSGYVCHRLIEGSPRG